MNINLLHGDDVRCIVTHLIQNAFLPEQKEKCKEKSSKNIVLLFYLYSQLRAHCGQ